MPAEESQEDEDPDMAAARALLEAKDRFKKQRLRTYLEEKAVRIRANAPEDLTTSDVQEASTMPKLLQTSLLGHVIQNFDKCQGNEDVSLAVNHIINIPAINPICLASPYQR